MTLITNSHVPNHVRREHDKYMEWARAADSIDDAKSHERAAVKAAEAGGFSASKLTYDELRAIARKGHDEYPTDDDEMSESTVTANECMAT